MANSNNGSYYEQTNSYGQRPPTSFQKLNPNFQRIRSPANRNSRASTNDSMMRETPTAPTNNSQISTITRPSDASDKETQNTSNQSDSSTVVQPKRTLENDVVQKQKTSNIGRSRLFVGNLPFDLKEETLRELFSSHGNIIEIYVNTERGFAFVKMATRQEAERIKHQFDGHVISNKAIRVRFASQGTMVKVKNLSYAVSNELLKEAFQSYFGTVESAFVHVDDRGRSIGEGIVEFEKKPSAQKCLKECTENCFFLTNSLRPVTVEPWDMRDEEDGLPEKSLTKDDFYYKERQSKARFAVENSFENMVGLKWKELELQEKQLLEEVKQRMQCAAENLKLEIDQMLLNHQAEKLREELNRRQEDLRRIDERRFRSMMPGHQYEQFYGPLGNLYPDPQFVSNDLGAGEYCFGYDNFSQMSMPNSVDGFTAGPTVDANYTTNQIATGYDDYNHQSQPFRHRKRARH